MWELRLDPQLLSLWLRHLKLSRHRRKTQKHQCLLSYSALHSISEPVLLCRWQHHKHNLRRATRRTHDPSHLLPSSMVLATASYRGLFVLLPSHALPNLLWLHSPQRQHQSRLLLPHEILPLHTMRLRPSRLGHLLNDTSTFIPSSSIPSLMMPSILLHPGSW